MTNPQLTSHADNETMSFENAFVRLEAILERMNSNAVSLDESLKLFEEADKLIAACNKKLNEAESKVEMLIKNRNGELVMNSEQKPMTQNFCSPTQQQPF